MKKYGLRFISLSVLTAVALAVCMAAGASAKWRVLGSDTLVDKEVVPSIHQNIVFLVPSLNLAITCTFILGSSTKIIANSILATGQLRFSSCTTKVKETAQPLCNPINQPIKLGGLARVVLGEGTRTLVLSEPEAAGGNFGAIEFSKECALTETSNVSGKFLAECLTPALATASCSAEEFSHLAKQQASSKDVLKFGKREMSADGVVKFELVEGDKWSGNV